MNSFNLHIYEAEGLVYEGECVSLTVPGLDGGYGIMAGHERAVCGLVPGILTYRVSEGQEAESIVVSGGMVRISGSEVTVLTESAERPEEIDTERAKRAMTESEEILQGAASHREYRSAEARLSRALNRLKSARKL